MCCSWAVKQVLLYTYNERLHPLHQNRSAASQLWGVLQLRSVCHGALAGLGPRWCRGQTAKAGQKGSKTQRCTKNYFQGRSFSVFHVASAGLSSVFSEITGLILNSDHQILSSAWICSLCSFPKPSWGELWWPPRWNPL